jgi:hypothetical protein
MATTAQYTAEPILESFSVNSVDVSRTSPTTTTQLISGPDTLPQPGFGKRIFKVTVIDCSATSIDNVIRFWMSYDGGTTKFLLCEKAITATAASSTTIGFRLEVTELVGLIIPASESATTSLYMSSHLNGTYHVTFESGLL